MNIELAMQALADAKAHPGNFDMNIWFDGAGCVLTKDREDFTPPCGTTACYAGFVSLRAAPVGSVVKGAFVFPPGTSPDTGIGARHVENYAKEALDIDPEQAKSIFYLDTIDQVEAAVNYLAGNPDVSGDTLWEMFASPGAEFPFSDDDDS